MSVIEIISLGFALSLDCFAVSLALSAAGHIYDVRSGFRIAFHFGLFQALMAMTGWVVRAQIEPYIAAFDHWIAFGLLMSVAIRMVLASRRGIETESTEDPTRGWMLVTLSTATSIDALAVGLGLATLGTSVWYPSAIIGFVTMIVSTAAIVSGKRATAVLGARAQIVGAAVLLIIALKIVISHTT